MTQVKILLTVITDKQLHDNKNWHKPKLLHRVKIVRWKDIIMTKSWTDDKVNFDFAKLNILR